EPDLDLEADLSVDSIKRTEIAGELATRLGAGRDAARLDDTELEDLAKARTARAIPDWLIARLPTADAPPGLPGPPSPPSPATVPTATEPVAADAPSSAGVAPKRLVVQRISVAAEPGPEDALAGSTFVVVGGPEGVSGEVRRLLAQHGAGVVDSPVPGQPVDGPVPGERVDGVVHLGGLDGGDEPVL